MVGVYREAGGPGPVVLVRRAWIGGAPPLELEKARDALVRETVPVYKRDAWLSPEEMIINGESHEVADQLADVMDQTGADALNLRVHVPGLHPAAVVDQIGLLRDVLPQLRGRMTPDRRDAMYEDREGRDV